MSSLAECDKNLFKEGCLEFCMDPSNECDDNGNLAYCKSRLNQIRGNNSSLEDAENIHQNANECKCLLTGPSTRLERRLDEANHQNYACWSPHCRDGTVPKKGQLSKPSWWKDLGHCAAINFCTINIEGNIQQYGNSIMPIHNCSDEQTSHAQKELSEPLQLEPLSNEVSVVKSFGLMNSIIIAIVTVIIMILIGFLFFRANELQLSLNAIKESFQKKKAGRRGVAGQAGQSATGRTSSARE